MMTGFYSSRVKWKGYAGALLGVALVTACFRWLLHRGLFLSEVNTTTVALSYLIVVLLVASRQGHGPGIFASVVGMLCFNFFFLPPNFTLTIEDPQNWVALTAFLVTALIASRLWSHGRARAHEAERHREEVWQLYQLSRSIIAAFDPDELLGTTAQRVAEIFAVKHCAVCKPDWADEWRCLSSSSAPSGECEAAPFTPDDAAMSEVFHTGRVTSITQARAGDTATYLPLKSADSCVGVLVIVAARMERETMEAIAGLTTMAFERARFLRELSRAEAVKESDELKSLLLASVSHDLRTPLTSIRASVENLLAEGLEWDEAALREFHSIIGEEVQRLMRLVENLLEMGRIEAGELHPALRWESVAEVCANVVERCAAQLKSHRVRLECADGLPAVKVDARLIAEALANLLENAAKYSRAGGLISLRATVDDEGLKLSVTDEGPGIAPEEAERVFERFYRGRRDGQPHGTGLGLAIARGLVEAHGGRIWVENQAGGATFVMALPVETQRTTRRVLAGGAR